MPYKYNLYTEKNNGEAGRAGRPLAELHSSAFGLLHFGPSHNLLRHCSAITCILRAPPPTPVLGWTGPPGPAARPERPTHGAKNKAPQEICRAIERINA